MTEAQFRDAIVNDLPAFAHDPLAFVMWCYPWGHAGGPLEHDDGPESWQRDILVDITLKLSGGASAADALATAVQEAVASGHGVGKSALVAWLIEWAMATSADTRGVVTANTEKQLLTKTWPELSKWHNMALTAFMFECTATAFISTQKGHEKNWRIDAIAWSERNTEAFAGLHNEGKRILLIFDEASAIPDIIWETAEGALTDANAEIVWCAFGNPTRTNGRFRECFGRFKHRWHTMQVDSRSTSRSNKVQIANWLADFGEDSDFFRIRVRGVFPRAAFNQFISSDVLDEAKRRIPQRDDGAPLVLGIDVARFGDDMTVFRFRQGRDAVSIPPLKYRGKTTTELCGYLSDTLGKYPAIRAVCIDGGGVGGGLIDQAKALGYPVHEVQFGAGARDNQKYANKRAEIWGAMRDWMATASIDSDQDLIDDLEGIQYGFHKLTQAIVMEAKDVMKLRGLASPDNGDALACTFAINLARDDLPIRARKAQARGRQAIYRDEPEGW